LANPEIKSEDVFHAIGFTNQDVLSGAHMALMQRLIAPKASGTLVRKLVEVYFLDSFVGSGDGEFERLYGDKYLSVYFYNETALTLSSQYGIKLPPVIGKITRADLPKGFGTSIRHPAFIQP
jgi:hypothetical protein